jgi:hypothetical protein
MENDTLLLRQLLLDLRDQLHAVQVTVSEDLPSGNVVPQDHAVLVDLADAMADVTGACAEAAAVADRLAAAAESDADPAAVRRMLIGVHECVIRAHARLEANLFDTDRRVELWRATRAWGPDWSSWLRVVIVGLRDVTPTFTQLDRQLLSCWRSLTASTAAGAISVRAVGQHIEVGNGRPSNEFSLRGETTS